MPCTMPPMIWPSTSGGFTIVPQSFTAKYLSSVTCPVSGSTSTIGMWHACDTIG